MPVNPVTPQDVHDQLVEARGAEYGNSWKLTDEFIREHMDAIAMGPSPFALIMIHNKLMRALTTPSKCDHYDDIVGYCKLMLRAIADEQVQERQARPVTSWLTAREP